MRLHITIALIALASSCSLFDIGDPCAEVDSGDCVALTDFTLDETKIVEGDGVRVWSATFADPDSADNRAITLACVVESDFSNCRKSFAMPDLDRLPHGEATLTTDSSSTESLRGSFRITEVLPLGDGETIRFTGSVDELYFDTPDGELVIVGGTFDVGARVVAPQE